MLAVVLPGEFEGDGFVRHVERFLYRFCTEPKPRLVICLSESREEKVKWPTA
ncbi:hypothetical protein D3C80_2237180 [compost metagenome]